ncbi:bacterial alpha-l-rhamnosidase domain-containing protein [Phlyctema vagabunda]|uniref:Bacterial alpha-l-rhamnosidase domain-containing protein n=1 Tax=Phlyctema vagabunda TaxID=108571 RepID=A0ABR4PU25_9HELO
MPSSAGTTSGEAAAVAQSALDVPGTTFPQSMAQPYFSSEGVEAAFVGPWDRYNFSPASRTQYPVRIFRTTGIVENTSAVLDFGSTVIRSIPQTNGWTSHSCPYSSVTFDFGKEACGPVRLRTGAKTTAASMVALSYAESSSWVSFDSDESSSLRTSVVDGHDEFEIGPNETYTVPTEKQRGGYRYVTVFTKTADAVLELTEISAEFTSMPHWQDLKAYPSYFYSSDDLLNRLWYAGAYTNQLSTLAKDQGRRCELDSGWLNNAVCCTSGDTIITDAPRRDRTIWAGDLAIVIWTQFATLNDQISMKNGLDTLFGVQNEDGHFPWAGPPICHDSVSKIAKKDTWPYVSDSYHLWTILTARNYYHLTGDVEWLKGKWDAIVRALDLASTNFNDTEGLYCCKGALDWGRTSVEGFNLSCNILFHETLNSISSLAIMLNQSSLAERWISIANRLKPHLERFWDPTIGLYFDNLNNRDLHPQDGNSLACWFGIASQERAGIITASLKKRWGEYGPVNPECSGPISPFISGFELQALVKANKIHDALEMIRTTWGWMINNPSSTGSTMLEAWYRDGTITYPFYAEKPSYISHCHPFSTGPLMVLTYEILGLNFAGDETEKGGQVWEFRPTVGDLDFCEGGFTGKYGLYSAGWRKTRAEGKVQFDCWIDTPPGTLGRVRLPVFDTSGGRTLVVRNGERQKYDIADGHLWIEPVEGGRKHQFHI